MKQLLKKLFRAGKRFLDKTFGTAPDEFYWRFRHIFQNREWAQRYLSDESLRHPHRKLLIDAICRFEPLESVLEIGCASGPNLFFLSERLPHAKLYGVDISKKAVQVGTELMKEKNIRNVFLTCRKADDLSPFRDKSIDVVFTAATLVCIGPDKIKAALREMTRVAKKAIVLLEWHTDSNTSVYEDHWAHNYEKLFGEIAPQAEIIKTKIPENIWPGEWSKFGYIVEAILTK